MFDTWVKDYVKCNGYNVEPVPILCSVSGGAGKSHSMKVIYKDLTNA